MEERDLAAFGALVRNARSRRRFNEGAAVPREALTSLVDIARQVPSGANRQPLRYRLVTDAAERDDVFAQLKWAGALPEWDGPEPGERPRAYIVICDAGHGATTQVDEGIAAQTLLLAATSAGLGGCMLHAFNKAEVARALDLPDGLRPLMVFAVGVPVEEVRLEPLSASPDGGTDYWRDEDAVHHVPKRALEDVLI
ncbi:MAG: nitroreductase family protein [Coriobacteriaceae bacterium]|nr:nitroreductase family protein [Coriobacteriaceae bacterium]